MIYNIYTDGSASQKGFGHGVVIFNENNNEKNLIAAHSENIKDKSTNNREELKAIIDAIEYSNKSIENFFVIYSDSSYCVKSINEWIPNWVTKNWKNSQKKTVENKDLMEKLYNLIYDKTLNQIKKNLNYRVEWIKGHNNIIGNELADALATKDSLKFKKIIKENNITYNDTKIF